MPIQKSGREINELALNFRATDKTSPLAVATLLPGVQKDRSGQISIGGLRPYATSVSIDGVSTLNARLNGPVADLFPSVEAISEFKISAVNNSAEFAQASDLTTTTRNGGNDLHGSAYWFHQNRALNATDPFAPQDPANPSKRLKAALVANSFGGVISGPIVKDRTFYFFDYEGVRRPSQSTVRQVVPPDAWRRGDLSSIQTPLINPFTGQAYPNNQIPINATSAKALELLYPKQNQATGTNLGAPNYILNVPGNYKIDGFHARVDHIFNDRHKAFARYTFKNIDSTGTNGSGDYNTLAGVYSRPINVRNLAASYNWIISPKLINELRGGFSTTGASCSTTSTEVPAPLPDITVNPVTVRPATIST